MIRASTLTSSTILGSLAFALAVTPARADDVNTQELLNLSLEQLSNIEVTSVSKTSEKANEAAAAIYVITQDDIRRSGATSIPEVLRIVPGLEVAQSGSHEWAITSRGFNDEFANKLLVLIDGRTVYTPLFSGVYWDVQDTPMEDIERIEVIRGPGATLWGANAVNGVINIITKNSKDTQGGFVSESAGNLDNSLTTVREGAKLGDDAYVRMYAKYDDYAPFKTLSGVDAHDAWDKAQSGFRSDWKGAAGQSFTLQGDMYEAGENNILGLPIVNSASLDTVEEREIERGANLLGRWDDKISKDSDLTAQLYYDDARRTNIIFASDIETLDFDLQHVWTPDDRNEIVSGAGYRLVDSHIGGNTYIQFLPPGRQDNLFSAFAQDKIALIPSEVFLTLGSKLERNDYTGFEVEPSARLSWLVDNTQTVWSAISRAVRTPNIATADVQTYVTSTGLNEIGANVGSKTAESEELVAYELGYRIQPIKTVSLDVSTFYNSYNRLLLGVPGTPYMETSGLGTLQIDPVSLQNVGTAHSWGAETEAKWNPTSTIELAAGYTLLELKIAQPDTYGFNFENKTPQQQYNLRASFQLPHDVEFDTTLYYVDPITAFAIDGYYRLDTKLSWKPIDSLELSLVGQNLLDNEHQEFGGFLYQTNTASQVPRSFYGNITWKF